MEILNENFAYCIESFWMYIDLTAKEPCKIRYKTCYVPLNLRSFKMDFVSVHS